MQFLKKLILFGALFLCLFFVSKLKNEKKSPEKNTLSLTDFREQEKNKGQEKFFVQTKNSAQEKVSALQENNLQEHKSPEKKHASTKNGERVFLLYIVDGDTIAIRTHNGNTEHVRLIGIDCPESRAEFPDGKGGVRKNKRLDIQAKERHIKKERLLALGKKATAQIHSLLDAEKEIFLEWDQERRDRYKRLLAYVYDTKGHFINLELVKSGFAWSMEFAPNLLYRQILFEAEQQAKEKNLGIWAAY